MDLSLSLLVIRFAVGLLIFGHGAQKVLGVAGGPGFVRWSGVVASMGFRPAPLWATLAAGAELIGGIAIALGLLTPLAAAALVGHFIVAIAKAHWPKGMWASAGGYEYPFVLMLVCAAIGMSGPGVYSVDAALGWDRASPSVFIPLALGAIIADAIALRAARPTAPPQREQQRPAPPRSHAA